ncbi:ComF family protein [Brevibacillus fortis]|uniref:Phosphoribosyltransferase domain-containing protein n=1 Tax=Brevibacillus fortis TaxID=2126352 RepID=A0A2P7VH21_9BACL|nr:topoisomerase DNA-binding C4 zinc finger domain-containing protein [Brevibacillus fortis]PSJ98533.1 hypothetical protein C7R93_06210 [Brevibacillus fortis]
MFIEVNDLKGLIIKANLYDSVDNDFWNEITSSLNCALIIDEGQLSIWKSNFGNRVIYIENDYWSSIDSIVNKAILELQLQPCDVAFVSDQHSEIKDVLSAAFGTVLISENDVEYSQYGEMPDFRFRKFTDFKKVTTDRSFGYFSEVFSTRIGKNKLSSRGRIFHFEVNNLRAKYRVFTGGRYFTREHCKYSFHQLSHRIRKSKDETSEDTLFTEIFVKIISAMLKNMKIDGLTRVPPKPSNTRDRLGPIVANVSTHLKIQDLSKSLNCTEDYPSQKGLNAIERELNVRDKFSASSNVENKTIILLDDVFTTGATATECVHTLRKAGVSDVIVVTIAANQFGVFRDSPFLPCPECGEQLVLKLSKYGNAFFGCTEYSSGCKGSMYYSDGRIELNKLNLI